MKLGIMSAVFRGHPIEEAARRLREGGFTCTQLTPEFAGLDCYRYGRAADLSGLTPGVRRRIRDAYTPIPANVAAYEQLYREYVAAYEWFGRGNGMMRRLRRIGTPEPVGVLS